MAIYFFDKNQTLIKIVPESATFEAIQTQELDDDSLLKDTLSVTVKGDEKLLNAEYMAVKSYTGNAQTFDMYRIVTDTTPDKSMSFTGMSLAPYELNGHIIQDLRPTNHSLSYTLNRVLNGTDWRVGYIEDGLSNVTTTFYYVSAKEALKELQSLVGCEFVFKVEISGQKITDKWIEVYKEMGNRTKKRFNYGTNALTVVRETNKADIYTALIGRGKGEEVSSGEDNESGQAGYGRKITFEDIEWSIAKGNPLDKPKGQYYLELPQATQAYGIKNIDGTMKARVGIVDFDDEEDKNRLINLTYQQLLVSSRPKVLFKTTVANVGETGIGDTVTIHRHDLNIHYQTRVRKIVRNKLNDNKTQIELGDAVVTPSTKRAKENNATIKNLNQEIEKVKADVTISQTSADGKNTIFYGSAEPTRKRTGDTWYRPHPSIAGETQMLVWNGTAWELVVDSSDLTSVSKEVEEATKVADEAIQSAQDAVEQIDAAVANAGFTSLDDTIQNISGIASGVKSELDIAIENAGFTSLDDTIKNMKYIAMDAEENAQQAITNASNAYGLAQTSISEAQTAQANALTALGKADSALDGVSNLDIRVDDVEAELELKADNTFMNEDGTLTTLSNAITFNAHRFSSDMSRIESRVESLAGVVNLVILRGSIENRYLYGGEVFPNAQVGSVHNSNVMGELIEVEGGETFALSKEMTGIDDIWRINFYDENQNFISRFHPPANTQDIMNAPANARYMWVAYPKNSKPQIIRGTDFIPYRPNITDQLTSDEMVIFRNEYDEFADETVRRLTAIDSSDGRLATAELLIEQTADGLSLKADQTTVNELTDEVESLGTEFDVVAGQVSSKVWMSDIDDIEIGGRNYWVIAESSEHYSRTWTIGTLYSEENSVSSGLIPTEPNEQFNINYPDYSSQTMYYNKSKEYIGSFSGLRMVTPSSGEGYSHLNTLGRPMDDIPAYVSYVFRNNFMEYNPDYRIMLEKGNKATDWTPAPEDTDAKIDYVESEWTQTFDTFSQTVSGIDGRVTTQKQTIDTISSTVSGHGGRISTVEQIADGLQTTVADKASQSQVTQLANGVMSLVSGLNSRKNHIPYWELGGLVWADGREVSADDRIRTPLIEKRHQGLVTYSFSEDGIPVNFGVIRYKRNGDYYAHSQGSLTVTLSDEVPYVRLVMMNTTSLNRRFQMEVGGVTEFAPYASDVSQTQISQLKDSITSTVSSIDGRVTTQKQTIDTISSTVSGHGGRISAVEQTASGLQSTVADKASQSQVTQLANGLTSLVTDLNSKKNLIPHWELGGLVWETGQETAADDRIRTPLIEKRHPGFVTYSFSEDGEPVNFGAIRYTRSGNYYAHSQETNSVTLSDSVPYVRLIKTDTTSLNRRFQMEVGGVTPFVPYASDVSQSQISQLKDNINFRVSKGELLSQINVQAGGVLITSGTNKLNITPTTTYIQNGTIKSAMIESLEAGKIKTGTLDAGKVKVINIDAENITSNKTSFVQSVWNGLNAFTQIDANGIQMLGSGTWRRTFLSPTGFRLFNGVDGNNKSGAIGYFKSSQDLDGVSNPLNEDFMWQTQQRHAIGIGVNETHLLTLGYQLPGAGNANGYNPALTIDPQKNGQVTINTDARFNNNLQVDGNLTLPGGDAFTTYNGLYLNTSYWTVQAKTGVRFFVGGQKKIHIGGNVELGTTLDMAGNAITGQSDYRLKKNIETLNTNDLDKLTGVRMVSYEWIDPERPKGTHVGFIAQELQEVYPEFITENDEGILSINNSELAMAHIHATQELNTKVDNEISQLKAQIASLQDELALLKGA